MEAATCWIEARKDELREQGRIRGYRFNKTGRVKKRGLLFFHINYEIEVMKTAYRKKGINASNAEKNRKAYKKIGKVIKAVANRILEVETASKKLRMSKLKNLACLLEHGGEEFIATEEKCIRTFDMTGFVRMKKSEVARKEVARVITMQSQMEKDEAAKVLGFEVERVLI
jgi:hypothetical protein